MNCFFSGKLIPQCPNLVCGSSYALNMFQNPSDLPKIQPLRTKLQLLDEDRCGNVEVIILLVAS